MKVTATRTGMSMWNPGSALMTRDEEDFWDAVDARSRILLANRPSTAELRTLVVNADPRERAAVGDYLKEEGACDDGSFTELVLCIARDPHALASKSVVHALERVGSALSEAFAAHPNVDVRRFVVQEVEVEHSAFFEDDDDLVSDSAWASAAARASASKQDVFVSHQRVRVRVALAGNGELTSEIASRLARDRSPKVRKRLAENWTIPSEAMVILSTDRNSRIAGIAKRHLPRSVRAPVDGAYADLFTALGLEVHPDLAANCERFRDRARRQLPWLLDGPDGSVVALVGMLVNDARTDAGEDEEVLSVGGAIDCIVERTNDAAPGRRCLVPRPFVPIGRCDSGFLLLNVVNGHLVFLDGEGQTGYSLARQSHVEHLGSMEHHLQAPTP
jgi:hypothetical protein